MITKLTCQLYCNPPERLKNKIRIQCREFDNEDMKDYIFADNSQDIDFWIDVVNLQFHYRKNITACMVKINDGDLEDIWLSESSRPYDLIDGWYNSLKYYLISRRRGTGCN